MGGGRGSSNLVAEDLAGEWSGWFLITIATIFPEGAPVTSINAASSQARVWFPHIPRLKTRLDFLEAALIEICMKPSFKAAHYFDFPLVFLTDSRPLFACVGQE